MGAHDPVRRVPRRLLAWPLALLPALAAAAPLPAQAPPAAPAPASPAPEQPAKKAAVQIHGTVVDEENKPVAGAVVSGWATATIQQPPAPVMTFPSVPDATADADGAFRVEISGGYGELVVTLRARRGHAFTARPVELRGEALSKPVTLQVSPRNARAARVRLLDEGGKPVAGAAVAVLHNPGGPAVGGPAGGRAVELPGNAPRAPDAEGRFETPRCLAPDGSYQLEVKAAGFLTEKTPRKPGVDPGPLDFGDVVLRRAHTLEGRVVDRAGKPVAGARVVRADSRQRSDAVTDADGRFKVSAALAPPGFVFVEKAGFRFSGQRCDKADPLTITLTRRDEAPGQRMTTLPPALPRAERKALAVRLLEPTLRAAPGKGDDDRVQRLEALAKVDPGRLLEELDRQTFKEALYDSFLRYGAAKALLAEAPDEARAVVESIRDPRVRVHGYLDLCDALPAGDRAGRLALLDEALKHSRAVEANDHRVLQLAAVARRLWALGEKERATKLLREGEAIARELPTAAWAGYARGAFAEDLALVDLPAALGLMKDLKDPMEYARHHGNLAHKLAGINPAEAERILGLVAKPGEVQQTFQRDQYAVRVCYRMAPADLPRARRIAGAIEDPYFKARAYGVMAQALAKGKPAEALALLDEAFALLAAQVASGKDQFTNFYDASSLGMLMVPVAEQIDPALTAEFFWRAVSFRAPAGPDDEHSRMAGAAQAGALALAAARYDRGLAMQLVEDAAGRNTAAYSFRANHLPAAALADPRRAAALVEAVPDGPTKEYARRAVAAMLVAEGDAAWRAVHRALAAWWVDDEDL
jgi:hypothetical protein